MEVILIAAVTANGMIAHTSSEVVNWSRDLKLFREQTMGCTVIMGSRTAATLAEDLQGRKSVIMHRGMNPQEVLYSVEGSRCFIIGGASTYSLFAQYLTHVFLTIHPLIMRSDALPLFSYLEQDIELEFVKKVKVDGKSGIYQFQYKVKR
ncbi:MAG: dihydrofolate reductase [Fidelibacterota bacterium]